MKRITLLCHVIDNYGDIGFVYRLARSFRELYGEYELTLVVSNLESFSRLCPEVKPELAVQKVNGWNVLDWNGQKEVSDFLRKSFPDVVLQCFQCGRPEWFDHLLFDEDEKKCLVVNVEYLTAEEWADDFHLLKSGTRSASVKKINFMPGFTEKTGGLVLDKDFMKSLSDRFCALEKIKPYFSPEEFSVFDEDVFKVLVFNYQRDFSMEVQAFKAFAESTGRCLCFFAAPGLSCASITAAVSKFMNGARIIQLPYLPQVSWDALVTLMDFNIIRGEDSFSRACLSGVPFMWDIYPQEEEFHLVKLEAFLSRLEPFFSSRELFKKLRDYSIVYNYHPSSITGKEAQSVLDSLSVLSSSGGEERISVFTELLENYDEMKTAFEGFSRKLVSNGNLTEKLFKVIEK